MSWRWESRSVGESAARVGLGSWRIRSFFGTKRRRMAVALSSMKLSISTSLLALVLTYVSSWIASKVACGNCSHVGLSTLRV